MYILCSLWSVCMVNSTELKSSIFHLLASMEQSLIRAANKVVFQSELKIWQDMLQRWCRCVSVLNAHLPLRHEIINKTIHVVKRVTSIHTLIICDGIDINEVFKKILPAPCPPQPKEHFCTQVYSYIFTAINY